MSADWSRRDVLGGAVAALAAPALARSAPQQTSQLSPFRSHFELEPDWVHMAGLLLASHPRAVRAVIETHRDGFDRNPVHHLHSHDIQADTACRDAAARYMGVRAQDVALTDSTTMGLGLLYNGIVVRDDQEVLSTVHDHMATNDSLNLRSQRTGTKVRRIRLFENSATASVDEIVGRLAAEIKPETRVLAVTHVHSSTGMKLPLAEMAKAVAKANEGRTEEDRLLFCVDGVHGFGVEGQEIPSFGCDFFSAGCHKWIFGPRGTGVLWGRPEVQKWVRPTFASFTGWAGWGGRMTPGGFHSFEHRWALPAAFDLHLKWGRDNVRAHIHTLNRQCKEGLAKMPHVTLHTPMSTDLSAGLVCFEVKGFRPWEVAERLEAKKIIASTTPYAVSYARVTPSLLNTAEDVSKVLAVVRELGS